MESEKEEREKAENAKKIRELIEKLDNEEPNSAESPHEYTQRKLYGLARKDTDSKK